jgi:hypothetical protein
MSNPAQYELREEIRIHPFERRWFCSSIRKV